MSGTLLGVHLRMDIKMTCVLNEIGLLPQRKLTNLDSILNYLLEDTIEGLHFNHEEHILDEL